ncbi:MAG: methyltransferase domain-containing protein [Acidobacteria bacterium]|nr:methyltransferase domain-containing protein [Acidobacteriota bacterium]
MSLPLAGVCSRIAVFDEQLAQTKASLSVDFPWYPYNSLGGFYELIQRLSNATPAVLSITGQGQVLDLCCADGDVAFFLESLGYQVTAVDFAGTNCNRLAGIRAMKAALASSIEIHEMDLDSQFLLNDNYNLVIFMGGLYHLKNPFYVMDTLARHAVHVVLSTRIARYTPDRLIDMSSAPLAYLLAPNEANQDDTNYWIFSEPGLKRLFDRTNWELLSLLALGSEQSDPARNEADARIFCVLRSRLVPQGVELLDGWHKIESSGWRWTKREFAIGLPNTEPGVVLRLRLNFALADSVFNLLGPVTLTALADGEPLPSMLIPAPGEHSYVVTLPESRSVRFILNKSVPPGSLGDDRELGLIVTSVTAKREIGSFSSDG